MSDQTSGAHWKGPKETLEFLGLRLDSVSSSDLFEYMEKRVHGTQRSLIFYLNMHGACLAWDQPDLRNILNSSQMVFCDGDGVRFGAWMLGLKPTPKIAITRWIWDLAALCEKKRWGIYLLGGKAGVAEKAAERLKKHCPELIVTGTHHGYFDEHESDAVIQRINQSPPQLLLVCLGMPSQEKWLARNKEKLNVPLLMTGGGVLDYTAGHLGRAPQWMIDFHLEWLFRIWREPGRLLGRYATEIPYFFYRISAERIQKLFRSDSK